MLRVKAIEANVMPVVNFHPPVYQQGTPILKIIKALLPPLLEKDQSKHSQLPDRKECHLICVNWATSYYEMVTYRSSFFHRVKFQDGKYSSLREQS